MTRPSLQRIVVLGIGNMLWADEGFGVRCVEALQQRFEFAPHVELVDGGTQGLALLQYVQALRDVPRQSGFPGDIDWPVNPLDAAMKGEHHAGQN